MPRPRTTVPPPKELIKLGEELVKWATEKTREFRAHLTQWYSLKKGFTKDEFDLMIAKQEFKEYYERAKAAIAIRYIDGTVNASIAHRFLRHYFTEVKREEDGLIKLKAELNKKDEQINDLELLLDFVKTKKFHKVKKDDYCPKPSGTEETRSDGNNGEGYRTDD